MKKYIFMAAALMMGMGMSSCSNDNEIAEAEKAPKMVQLTLTASFDVEDGTRAVWANSVTPRFDISDNVGVYSDNQTNAQMLTVTSVDGEGNATLTGYVTEASEYHLVYPYKASSTYNKDANPKTITGFYNFSKSNEGADRYPDSALHYAHISSSETKVTFENLCAIIECTHKYDDLFVLKADILSPVITIGNDGVASVTASTRTLTGSSTSAEWQSAQLTVDKVYPTYLPVAPGEVTLMVRNGSSGDRSRTATVKKGKIYHIQEQ